MYRKFLISTAFVALATASMAADLPATKGPAYFAAPVPLFTWTGFYVGLTGGGALTSSDVGLSAVNGPTPNYRTVPNEIAAINALGSVRLRNSNGIFGARAGYNQQFGSFVLGLEGDISSFRSNKSSTRTGNPFFPFAGNAVSPAFATFNTTVSTDWLATARLRAGFAVDRALFYATGGAAFGNVKFKNREREFSNNGLGFGNESSAVSKTKTGWALGVGAEYAITSNVLLSAEYLHVDLGSVTASGRVTSNNTRTATLNFRTKVKSEIGRVGLSYKF